MSCGNIVLLIDKEKPNGITCSELNQFARSTEYKLNIILFLILFICLYVITDLPRLHGIGARVKLG